MNKIFTGDCLHNLKKMEDNSVDCVVTSPPYFGLRDYGVDGQIGLEQTPADYVRAMVRVFRQVRRVLRDDGTLWLNLGDSYCGYKGPNYERLHKKTHVPGSHNIGSPKTIGSKLKNKDLIGIPWRVAFALQADGWYLRQDIIWHKPNPMPESVTDRCTKAHEYIFLMSKSPRYYFDQKAISLPLASSTINRIKQDIDNQTGSARIPGKTNGTMKAVVNKSLIFGGQKWSDFKPEKGEPNYRSGSEQRGRQYAPSSDLTRNKRSVWTVSTKPFKDAHFATYPPDLIAPCILAGCRPGGVVLDPFMGSGTTGIVALRLDREFVGIELNPDYVKIAAKRFDKELGMFNPFK